MFCLLLDAETGFSRQIVSRKDGFTQGSVLLTLLIPSSIKGMVICLA